MTRAIPLALAVSVALACTSSKQVDFAADELARVLYAETIETLALAHPPCAAAAWSQLSAADQEAVVRSLRAPLYSTPDQLRDSALASQVAESFPHFARAMGW